MKPFSTLLKTSALVIAGLVGSVTNSSAQAFSEDFNDITTLAASGWSLQNLSTPVGSTNWFQGTNVAAGGPFDSYNGAANAYIGANYNNTGSTGTISNWLMTPNRTFRNGDVFTFYSRKVSPDSYADRLEVRMSTNGPSTNAGANATTVGDFTTLVMSINPTLVLGVYPIVWTQYTITISGLPAPTSGRLAFRYFVTGAGASGSNSDYIGIDAVNYTPYVCPTITVSGTLAAGTAGTAYSQALSQTGSLGAPTFIVTAGSLPSGLTLSASGTISGTPTATGTFNFTVTVSDASGCSGSQSYSITIVCPTGGATLSSFPALCNNGTPYTLTEGSPAGGTYSGTGVSGGMFNPASGTQTITYMVNDVYGCMQMASASLTVNAAPTVTLSSFAPVCDNGGMVTLTGESPAGGTWSGTNVSGNMFDPASGTQTISYMYTDANGCSNTASQSLTVNAAPVVTIASFTPACNNDGMVTLTGESPAGGTWSGTGVTGNMFDAASGTQTISYMYTDANGCSNSASQSLTVNIAPAVTASSTASTICPGGMVTLTGGGATTYSWDNSVTDGVPFAPAATTTYIVTGTDGNGCSDSASIAVTINSVLPIVANATPTAVCAGGNLTLTGSGAVSYTWDNSVVDGVPFTPASTMTYNVAGTDANGCTGSASVTVVVNALPTVAGSASSTTVCLDDANVTLTGTPAGGTWSGTGVTGSSFDPTAAGVGPEVVSYSYTDSNGCDGVAATVTITVNACVGIEEEAAANGINVYPNPNDGSFFVTVNSDATMIVYNSTGEVVLSQNVIAGTTAVNLNEFANGIYLVSILNDNTVNTVRISKQ
ncbi:MAG: choice-of-anchor J domain-containing protein [Bacteroidota bacterium]|nr:choice-of-anchor J domain-containing protein [Bacteroidota bacterium]